MAIECIESFAAASFSTMLREVNISRQNFAILIIVRGGGPGPIPGELVEVGAGLDINSEIDFTEGRFLTTSAEVFPNTVNSLASVLVSSTLYQVFQSTSSRTDDLVRLVFVVFDIDSPFFQDPNNTNTGSVILSFLRSPEDGPTPTNLDEPVRFWFEAIQVLLS